MTEQTETTPELSIVPGERDGEEPPKYHTILEIWKNLIGNVRTERDARVEPRWAVRIISENVGLTFENFAEFHKIFFDRCEKMLEILEDEIEADDECLNHTTPDEDVSENSEHYRDILHNWQLQMMRWELEWHPGSFTAAAEIAALSEIHRMFFGQTGFTGFLDNIKFEYTDADREKLSVALAEMQEA